MKPQDFPLSLFAHERLMFGRAMRRVITAIQPFLPKPRVICGRDGESPYLSRYYLLGGSPKMADGSSPFNAQGNPKKDAIWPEGRGLYLHRFHASDDGQELHNHPFAWSVGFILAGGYIEERLGDDFRKDDKGETPILRRAVLPLSVNFIWSDTFHRVDLVERDAWTLFLVGPRTQSWGFYDRVFRTVTPWREHLAKKRASSNIDNWGEPQWFRDQQQWFRDQQRHVAEYNERMAKVDAPKRKGQS